MLSQIKRGNEENSQKWTCLFCSVFSWRIQIVLWYTFFCFYPFIRYQSCITSSIDFVYKLFYVHAHIHKACMARRCTSPIMPHFISLTLLLSLSHDSFFSPPLFFSCYPTCVRYCRIYVGSYPFNTFDMFFLSSSQFVKWPVSRMINQMESEKG